LRLRQFRRVFLSSSGGIERRLRTSVFYLYNNYGPPEYAESQTRYNLYMEKRSGRYKLWMDIGLLYCAAIWGSTFIVVKDALAGVHPVAMVAIRFGMAALLLLPWVLRRPRFSAHLKEGAILSVFLTALYITQTYGLVYTSAANSGFITGLFIIFIPVFMFLRRRQRPKKLEALSAGLAVYGLWLLTGGAEGFNKGDALTLIAAVSYAAHVVITDKYIKGKVDMLLLAFHQFWCVSLTAFLLSAVMGYPLAVASAKLWWIIIFLALFPTLSAYFIQMVAQKDCEPFRIGLIFTLEPVFAALFAWTMGGEQFLLVKAAGGFLIVSGMMMGEAANFKARPKKEKLSV